MTGLLGGYVGSFVGILTAVTAALTIIYQIGGLAESEAPEVHDGAGRKSAA